jgi:SAM-dependent methyltransferase
MKKADWTLKEIAKENSKLNREYFKTGEYKNLEAFKSLGRAIDFIIKYNYDKVPTILDVGCGTGWYGIYILKKICPFYYIGIDISSHMCELAEQNAKDFGVICNFGLHDISKNPFETKTDIVLESAVLELADLDWKRVLENILNSSDKWVILHRLFYTEEKTKIEQVETYLNIPDIRIHIGLKELKEEIGKNGFKIVYEDKWKNEKTYKQGTWVLKK